MSAVVWLTGFAGCGLVWGVGDDVIDIKEYEAMFRGAALVCCMDIVFVMDRLGLRLRHDALEEKGVK